MRNQLIKEAAGNMPATVRERDAFVSRLRSLRRVVDQHAAQLDELSRELAELLRQADDANSLGRCGATGTPGPEAAGHRDRDQFRFSS